MPTPSVSTALPTMSDLSQGIVNALKSISTFPTMAGTGTGFDNTCAKTFLSEIRQACPPRKGYEVEELSPEECKKVRDYSLKKRKYPAPALHPYLVRISEKDYSFTGLAPLPSNEIYLLRQPCGSQEWPDLIVLCGNKAIPIEFKSSKDKNKLLWNSNLPRRGIYIFNGKPADKSVSSTTYFLAEDVIQALEVQLMEECRQDANKLAALTNDDLKKSDSKWSIYMRPMHNWSDALLQSCARKDREGAVIALAASYF